MRELVFYLPHSNLSGSTVHFKVLHLLTMQNPGPNLVVLGEVDEADWAGLGGHLMIQKQAPPSFTLVQSVTTF